MANSKLYESEMLNLIDKLNIYTKAYDEGHPLISDAEWDKMYFELDNLERLTGVRLPNSPTQQIVYQVVNNLPKVEHDHLMLSLDKTKSIDDIKAFQNNQELIYMLKLDGLTCSLTYENGKLTRAETRGNGIVGEDITHNALIMPSIPNFLPTDTPKIVIDGEVVCTHNDFVDFQDEYKNPRNFAAGSIRLLDAAECAKRKLTFVAWDVIQGFEHCPTLSCKLDKLYIDFGFRTVPYLTSDSADIQSFIDKLQNVHKALRQNYPIDGIVVKYNDVEYFNLQGRTDHHFKGGIAYKFYDETYSSTLKRIEWSLGRTGQLTPVAVFEPVDIDGSTIERANLHNITIMHDIFGKYPYVGEGVEVFKRNQVIPQIATAGPWKQEILETDGLLTIPKYCPQCGEPLKIRHEGVAEVLVCENPRCEGKTLEKFEHFVGKRGLNIKGISEKTITDLMNWGWLRECADIFRLKEHRNEWIHKPGYGFKSVDKILDAIEARTSPDFHEVIAAAGIPLIGLTAARTIAEHFGSWEDFRDATKKHYNFTKLKDFGGNTCLALWSFDYREIDRVIPYLNIKYTTQSRAGNNKLSGYRFAITGKVHLFKSRGELDAKIKSLGGNVVTQVTRKTNYLINNDPTSETNKNLTAKKLKVPIISEEEFIELLRSLE